MRTFLQFIVPTVCMAVSSLSAPAQATQPSNGFKAEYFATPTIFGQPAVTRVEPQIAHNWATEATPDGIARESFAVRFSGQIRPRFTERYTFTASADDGVRLYVNGTRIIDRWKRGAWRERGEIDLVAGQRYDLVLEYFQQFGGASVNLAWASASQPAELVAVAGPDAPKPPKILIGYDAQPVGNMDRTKAVGANAMHRFDSGPQKLTSMSDWLTEAGKRGLFVLVQGTAADAQGVDLSKFPYVIGVSQDDEPDLNRYDPRNPAAWMFSPADAPHPSTLGWTKPAVLDARYKSWKSRWPNLPVSANFSGNAINSAWYKSDLAFHAAYIKASDQHGSDTYPRNNRGDGGHLYWPANVTDKIRAAGGNPLDIYVECSDQALGGGGRGPTPAEQGTLVWSGLGHGARRIWYFPQKIGTASRPDFVYWNVRPENEARMASDAALIQKYADLIADGALTVVQTPKANADAYKGAVVWPSAETFTWTKGDATLTVIVDYVGGTAPIVLEPGAAAVPAPSTLPTTQPTTQPVCSCMSTRDLQILECVAGVETVRATLPFRDETGGAGGSRAAIRIELIGRRCRYWFEETGQDVTDRPPNGAVNLSRDESGTGGWGIYMKGGSGNGMLIYSFRARDLPSVCLPPPSFDVTDASAANLNLVAINAAVAGVSETAWRLEWEVYPADPDDIPEAYRDESAASITARTFLVRPGFAYDFRVREILDDGTRAAWTPYQRIHAPGVKVVSEVPVVPTGTVFPGVTPDYIMPAEQSADANAIVSDTGRERVTSRQYRPRRGFKWTFKHRQLAECQLLIDFFERMAGQDGIFGWTHPTSGEQFALRFAKDDYEIRYEDRNGESIVATIEFEVVEVFAGSVTAISATLELDDDLL